MYSFRMRARVLAIVTLSRITLNGIFLELSLSCQSVYIPRVNNLGFLYSYRY